jgi:hypothetical protein
MANPTTYFGWVMPTSSSLVTNLPADFNTFGQGVDTSMQDLLGGTTGQVLSKTSNTNMDFTWVTPTDQTPLTTKGDLFTFSTVDARLGVGTNGQTLVADSTASTGLKWATPSGGGFTMTSFTPTFTNLTLGNGTAVAYSGYSGDIAVVQIQVTFGSTTSTTGNVSFGSYPYAAKTTITDPNYGFTATTGTAIFTNASYMYAGQTLVGGTGGRAYYLTPPLPPDHNELRPMSTGTSPISWTTGAVVQFSAFYWRA